MIGISFGPHIEKNAFTHFIDPVDLPGSPGENPKSLVEESLPVEQGATARSPIDQSSVHSDLIQIPAGKAIIGMKEFDVKSDLRTNRQGVVDPPVPEIRHLEYQRLRSPAIHGESQTA